MLKLRHRTAAGFHPTAGHGHSVQSLDVLSVFTWVPSKYSGFPLKFKDMKVRLVLYFHMHHYLVVWVLCGQMHVID